MWKIVVGFLLFAALALFILSRGGDIDMGGEKHGDMGHTEAHAPAAAPASAPVPAVVGVAPAASSTASAAK